MKDSSESSIKDQSSKKVFLVAGEESANQYAIRLIKEGKKSGISYSGVGYPSLKDHGFDLVFDAKKLSVMGGIEVLKKISIINEAFRVSLESIKKNEPDVVLLIDFGGFNLKLAKSIKEWNPSQKIYYFISPKFWAWRESRVERVKKWVDKMFVIHPFEVDFYKKHNYEAALFVGHPLNQELKPEQFDLNKINDSKKELGFNLENPSLALLFGSRDAEIEKLGKPFLDIADSLIKDHPNLNLFTVVPPSFSKKSFEKKIKNIKQDLPIKFLQASDPMDVMALCDVALVASGTATLQLGLLEKPMAIGYKMNPITMFLAKCLVKGIKYAGLVNILSEKEVSKEFLQGDLKVEKVKKYLEELLYNKDIFMKQKSELKGLKSSLGDQNPYEVINNEILNTN
jgi:lipid-A-disaccharide synthase